MATNLDIPLESAIEHISRGTANEMKKRIKAALMAQAETIVEEVALAMCKDLMLNMQGYREEFDGRIAIQLTVNSKKIEV